MAARKLSDQSLNERINALNTNSPVKTEAELASEYTRIFGTVLPNTASSIKNLTPVAALMAEMNDQINLEHALNATAKKSDEQLARRVNALQDYSKLTLPQLTTLAKELTAHIQRLENGKKIMSSPTGKQNIEGQLQQTQARLTQVQTAMKHSPKETLVTAPTKPIEKQSPETQTKTLQATVAKLEKAFANPGYREQLDIIQARLAEPNQESQDTLDRFAKVISRHEALLEKTQQLTTNINKLTQEISPNNATPGLQAANTELAKVATPSPTLFEQKAAAPDQPKARAEIKENPDRQAFHLPTKTEFNIVDYMTKVEKQLQTSKELAQATIKTSPTFADKILQVASSLKKFAETCQQNFGLNTANQENQSKHNLA